MPPRKPQFEVISNILRLRDNFMSRRSKVILSILAFLVFALVVLPLIIPIPPPENTVSPTKLADPDSRFMSFNGINVHYKLTGKGEPALILLHGFASSVYTWREVMAPLAAHGTVVAYDRPAFGLTSRPLPGEWTGASPYSPEAQADMLFGLMDKLGIRKAIIAGNSAGGGIATLAALRNPDRVQALILVDPALSGNAGGMVPEWLKPILGSPQARRIGPLFVRNAKDWGLDLARRAWHDPTKITPEIWGGYLKPLQADNWDIGLYEFNLASGTLDLESRLGELHMPVLVVTGDDDRVVPTDRTVRVAKLIPGAKLALIPNCGHAPQEECPATFLQAMNDFVNSSPVTSR